MWLPFLFKRYEVRLQDSAVKQVDCESCSKSYSYLLSRHAYGESKAFILFNGAAAESVAYSRASNRLAQFLDEGCEPIPCPNCGHIQIHMFKRARQLRHRWMSKTFILFFPLAVLLFLPAIAMVEVYQKDQKVENWYWMVAAWSALGLLITVGFGLGIYKYMQSRNYDPNSEPLESRLEYAQEHALRDEEVDEHYAPVPGDN